MNEHIHVHLRLFFPLERRRPDMLWAMQDHVGPLSP